MAGCCPSSGSARRRGATPPTCSASGRTAAESPTAHQHGRHRGPGRRRARSTVRSGFAVRQGSRVERSGAARPPRSGLATATWKVSREQHRAVAATGPAERRRARLSLVADAPADADISGLTAALQRVCRAATAALGLQRCRRARDGREPGRTGVAACSDAEARAVAELQFTDQRGPRPGGVPHPAPRAGARLLDAALDRWPGFASLAMVARRPCACSRFPLQEGAVSFGVLELYADRAGPLDADGLAYRRRLRAGRHRAPARRRHRHRRRASSTRDCPPRSSTGPGSTRRRGW